MNKKKLIPFIKAIIRELKANIEFNLKIGYWSYALKLSRWILKQSSEESALRYRYRDMLILQTYILASSVFESLHGELVTTTAKAWEWEGLSFAPLTLSKCWECIYITRLKCYYWKLPRMIVLISRKIFSLYYYNPCFICNLTIIDF